MTSRKHAYFQIMAFILIFIAIGGFSLNALIHRDYFPPVYPLLITHISVMVGWFSLFVVQTQLIGRKNVRLHKKIGLWSVILAIGLVVIGVCINLETYKKGSDLVVVAGNFATMVNFSIMYFLGYYYRKKPLFHKRAMLLAGIAIVAPAIARFILAFELPMPLVFVFYLSLILSLVVFDIRTHKHVYRISWLGGLVLLVVLISAFTLGGTQGWHDFITWLWG